MAGTNADLVRRWFDEVWNQGKLATVDELLEAEGILHAEPGLVFKGPAAFKEFYSKITSAFSNMRMEIVETIEQDDRVAARWRATVTHSGQPWAGIAPLNKNAVITGISVAHFRNGKIVAGWDNWDAAGLTQQLQG